MKVKKMMLRTKRSCGAFRMKVTKNMKAPHLTTSPMVRRVRIFFQRVGVEVGGAGFHFPGRLAGGKFSDRIKEHQLEDQGGHHAVEKTLWSPFGLQAGLEIDRHVDQQENQHNLDNGIDGNEPA